MNRPKITGNHLRVTCDKMFRKQLSWDSRGLQSIATIKVVSTQIHCKQNDATPLVAMPTRLVVSVLLFLNRHTVPTSQIVSGRRGRKIWANSSMFGADMHSEAAIVETWRGQRVEFPTAAARIWTSPRRTMCKDIPPKGKITAKDAKFVIAYSSKVLFATWALPPLRIRRLIRRLV